MVQIASLLLIFPILPRTITLNRSNRHKKPVEPADLMKRWTDRVYGDSRIDHPNVLALIETPTFRRLAGVMQSGPSALVFPFKTVSRLEHSLGVYLLLERLGAGFQECIAGLLHDISHTAFSHAIDFLITSEEQNHHEGLKGLFLHRADITEALAQMGFKPEDFEDDTRYSLLEQPLPGLCADRIDYFLRDGLACGEIGQPFVNAFLRQLVVVDGRIAMSDACLTHEAVELFDRMNRHWWASRSESYIYNRFAELLGQAMDQGVISEDDLLTSDAEVIERIEESGNLLLRESLNRIRGFCPSELAGFVPRVVPKHRWIDPPVWSHGRLVHFSSLN